MFFHFSRSSARRSGGRFLNDVERVVGIAGREPRRYECAPLDTGEKTIQGGQGFQRRFLLIYGSRRPPVRAVLTGIRPARRIIGHHYFVRQCQATPPSFLKEVTTSGVAFG